jgi:hypothetical protein
MSAWKLATRALYDLGGSSTAARISMKAGGDLDVHSALGVATELGLVVAPGKGSNRWEPGSWVLTERGIDYCEGRVVQLERRPGGRYWASTWLASLPRDIRIAA